MSSSNSNVLQPYTAMKLRNLTLLALLCGLCFAAACSDDPVTGPEGDGFAKIDTSVAYPLDVGNKWVYQIYRSSTTPTTDTITVTAARDTIINGKSWTLLGNVDFASPTFTLYRSDPSGAWYFQRETGREIQASKLPPHIGDTVLGFAVEANCFVLDTIISVGAGKFHCVGYIEHDTQPTQTRYTYFAPGAGYVFDHIIDSAGVETYRKELISFQFK